MSDVRILLRAFTLLFALMLLAGPRSHAATLVVDPTGQLMGAKGVDVNGTFYDVAFRTGTCIDFFGPCDENTPLIFQTRALVAAAGNALMQQVFIDGPLGAFDTDPTKVATCRPAFMGYAACFVLIPDYIPPPPNCPGGRSPVGVFATVVQNSNLESDDEVATGAHYLCNDEFPRTIWAVFSLSTTPVPSTAEVPLPPAGALLLAAGCGLGLLRFRTGRVRA